MKSERNDTLSVAKPRSACKNTKTYLSHAKKVPLEVWLAPHCPGVKNTCTMKNNIVSNIVSFPPLDYSPLVLAVLLVVVLVVVLLSCWCCCLCLLCCHIANTATTTTISMPLPLPPLSVCVEIDACYTNADSSPAILLHAVCWIPTEGWWQLRGRGGGDHALGYNKGVGCHPMVWGVKLSGYSVNS